MKRILSLGLLILAACAAAVHAQNDVDSTSVEDPAIRAAKELSSRDPLARQRAAEELAGFGATDHRRLVEGYRLQEKNTRVKLALDWALYRMGKTDALFTVVRALDSSRSNQAQRYLDKLEVAEPLYFFLERMNGNTQVKLLEVLAKIGDADTIERIKPYSESLDPMIVDAAKDALREIEHRIGQMPSNTTTRPRQVAPGETSP